MDIQEDPFEMGDDFLQGVAPKELTHTEPKLKENFAPWHKPRKQWIRDQQWGRMIGALIDNLDLKRSGRPLNYLSLPGADLLDIRSLEDVFKDKQIKLKFLGLNHIEESDKEQKSEQNLSLNEVRALDYIEQESIVIPEQFEKISDASSIASDRVLRKNQSFDVINIDLCASFADKKPGGAMDTLYAAIYKLLQHQSHYRTEDWLFFITSRTDKKKVEFKALQRLLNITINSINKELAEEYIESKFGVDLEKVKSEDFTPDDLSTLQHHQCFTASLGIWKSVVLVSGDAKTKSSMKEVIGYHVESSEAVTDMVSLAFWCSRFPLVAADHTGLSTAKINPQAPSPDDVHRSQAKQAFERSLNFKDLDSYLTNNPRDYETALQRSKTLLRRARYSMDKYDGWLEEQQAKISAMLQPQ